MKNYIFKYINKLSAIVLIIWSVGTFVACEDTNDGSYKITEGIPEVYYVRFSNPDVADSLIVGAYMEQNICLVGNNLTSIKELYFNDQKALLNINFITNNTLLVNVPRTIPTTVTDKIYMITGNNDTIPYDFKVLVPNPIVSSISCEHIVDGGIATIYGDYLLDDPNKPLTITMAGNVKVTEILNIQKTQVTFKIPTGSQKGNINVSTIYGNGRSSFIFRDDRGIFLNFDNLRADGSWRPGTIEGNPTYSISGNYLKFSGSLGGGAWEWGDEAGFACYLWGQANGRPDAPLFTSDVASSIFKFEVNVLNKWSSVAMQFVFCDWNTSGNGPNSSAAYPRALWMPWQGKGADGFTTNGWVTVSIPLKDFKFDAGGNVLDKLPSKLGSFVIHVLQGGVEGIACSPTILIDNVRVVPAE